MFSLTTATTANTKTFMNKGFDVHKRFTHNKIMSFEHRKKYKEMKVFTQKEIKTNASVHTKITEN
jgi:hypothetical protein